MMITITEFIKYKYLGSFNFNKDISYIRKYVLVYDELNDPEKANERLLYFTTIFYLAKLFITFHFVYLGCVDLVQMHAAFSIDIVQYVGHNKKMNFGIAVHIIVLMYLNTKCYFDYPPFLLRQLKSILDNQPNVLFSFPYIFKSENPVALVQKSINRWLLVSDILIVGECLLLSSKDNQ